MDLLFETSQAHVFKIIILAKRFGAAQI